MNDKTMRKYCIGCGLCKSACNAQMEIKDSGYLGFCQQSLDKEVLTFAKKVCPATDEAVSALKKDDIWGRRVDSFFGWSTDDNVRKSASSGGVITGICLYLLESKQVDAIIHTKVSEESVIENRVHVSTCKEDVLKAMGSRYSPSSPLADIIAQVDRSKRYAFVGKPCDVAALRNYLQEKPEYKENFVYLLGFFCAGLPTKQANRKLLSSLGTNEKECKSLTYRGNGWPGMATAVSNSVSNSMTYEKAWGGILGRDVHPFCRFCMDGIGERADIACGDGWYLDENGNPSFEESEGRNIVFARTEKGKKLYEDAVSAGFLACERGITDDYLKNVQAYQYTRKACMKYKMLAHRIMFKDAPYKKISSVSAFKAFSNGKQRRKFFIGTVKRIIKGKV